MWRRSWIRRGATPAALIAGNVAYLRGRVQSLQQGLNGDAEARATVRLYNDERERLVRFSKLALEAGIEERRVRLEEQMGELMAISFMGVINDARLHLTTSQIKVAKSLMAERVRLISELQEQSDPIQAPIQGMRALPRGATNEH